MKIKKAEQIKFYLHFLWLQHRSAIGFVTFSLKVAEKVSIHILLGVACSLKTPIKNKLMKETFF